MANEESEMYLENLEEYIYDEDKIVTYKWLSRTLSVHVNQAKQMLYTFVNVERKKKTTHQLTVTYLLTGITQEDNVTIHKIQLVPEVSLDRAKSHLRPVTSCHVYSVQRSVLKDSNVLYMADIDLQQAEILNSNKCSAIKCMNAKIRSESAVNSLRPLSEEPATTVAQSTKTSMATATNSKPNNTGIAGMFAKAKPNTTNKSGNTQQGAAGHAKMQTSKQTGKAKGGTKSGGGLSFFGKQESKQQTASRPAGGSTDKKCSTGEKDSAVQSRKKIELDSNEEENPLPQQKRRRIRQVSESSSSEEDVQLDSPVPSPPPARESPSPRAGSPIPAQPDQPEEGGKMAGGEQHRGRKRKLVSKTSLDEDGFMDIGKQTWGDAGLWVRTKSQRRCGSMNLQVNLTTGKTPKRRTLHPKTSQKPISQRLLPRRRPRQTRLPGSKPLSCHSSRRSETVTNSAVGVTVVAVRMTSDSCVCYSDIYSCCDICRCPCDSRM